MRRLLYVAFFLEVGFVLLLVPWSDYWDRNYFLQSGSPARALLTNNFVRGGVSGLGVVNLVAGLADLAGYFLRRTPPRGTTIGPRADE